MYIADYFFLNTFYNAIDRTPIFHVTIRENP